MLSNSQMVTALFGLIALWTLEGAYLTLSRDAPRKRRLYPRILVSNVVLLTAFLSVVLELSIWGVLVVGALVALVTHLTYRSVWFCEACGYTARAGFSPPAYCSDCGARRPRGDARESRGPPAACGPGRLAC